MAFFAKFLYTQGRDLLHHQHLFGDGVANAAVPVKQPPALSFLSTFMCMKKLNRKQKLMVLAGVFFLLAQAFQPEKNKDSGYSNSNLSNVLPVPDTVQALLKQACFDCHSNHTRYPWYNLAPVSWWIAFHVTEGKRELNFSRFGKYTRHRQAESMEAILETVKHKSMPLPSYLWMHKEARLTDSQRRLISGWASQMMQYLRR